MKEILQPRLPIDLDSLSLDGAWALTFYVFSLWVHLMYSQEMRTVVQKYYLLYYFKQMF